MRIPFLISKSHFCRSLGLCQSVCQSCNGFWWFLLRHTFKGFFQLYFKVINLWKCDSVKPAKPTFLKRFSDKETILPFFVLKPSFLNPQVKLWHVTVLCHSITSCVGLLIKVWQWCHSMFTVSHNTCKLHKNSQTC